MMVGSKNSSQNKPFEEKQKVTLLEVMSFAINHYATGMQLVVVYNYFGHVCNYKFGIV